MLEIHTQEVWHQVGTCVFLNIFEFGSMLSTSPLVICMESLPCAILLWTYVYLYNYACPLICVIESHMPLPHPSSNLMLLCTGQLSQDRHGIQEVALLVE